MSQRVASIAHDSPLLGQLMDQMGWPAAVHEGVGRPPQGQEVETGTCVAGLIITILAHVPIRLYRLTECFQDKPLPVLVPWPPAGHAEPCDDARAERVLDDRWQADPQKVRRAVVQQVIQRSRPDRRQIPVETTSKSVYGASADQPDPAGPQITSGHSKDVRPDLTQRLFGVGMTGDGRRLVGEVTSGTQSEMTCNGHWITRVREPLALGAEECLWSVADSAVVTTDHVAWLREPHVDILSRLPERCDLAEQLMVQAQAASPESWEALGVIREAQGQGAASYRVWQTDAPLAGAVSRCVVVASSTLDTRHLKALKRAMARDVAADAKVAKATAAQAFHARGAAEMELAPLLRAWWGAYHRLQGRVESDEQRLRRPRRGRPRAGDVPPTVTGDRLRLERVPDEAAHQRARERCGRFVVITSLMARGQSPARHVLDPYKGQHRAEQALRVIKRPVWVGAFCVKTPARVAALGDVVLLAARVDTLLERHVRRALAAPGQPPVRGLDNRPTPRPTAYAIQVILSSIVVLEEVIAGHRRFRLHRPLSENQRRVWCLAGFSDAISHVVRPTDNAPSPSG